MTYFEGKVVIVTGKLTFSCATNGTNMQITLARSQKSISKVIRMQAELVPFGNFIAEQRTDEISNDIIAIVT